jgi:hypothetical protein
MILRRIIHCTLLSLFIISTALMINAIMNTSDVVNINTYMNSGVLFGLDTTYRVISNTTVVCENLQCLLDNDIVYTAGTGLIGFAPSSGQKITIYCGRMPIYESTSIILVLSCIGSILTLVILINSW